MCLWSSAVFAEAESGSGASFDELVAEAMTHYSERRYAEAIEAFEAAYEVDPEPELVYNIARSHERLAHRDEALAAYQLFIGLPGTTGELRARALENISSLRQEIAAMEAAEASSNTSEGNEETSGGETSGGSGSEGGGPPPPPPVAPPEEEGVGPMGVAGWVVGGVGVATMVVGAVFGGLALSANDDFMSADFSEERLQLRDDVEFRALMADVLLFSGVGLAVVGVVLVVIDTLRGRSDDDEDEAVGETGRLTIVPTLAAGGLGLGLGGRF